MACAKPVIASRLDGIPEQFNHGEHGLLTPPDDVDALVGAMDSLAADPAWRECLGAAGRTHVGRHFTREILAQRTRDLYLKLCAPQKTANGEPCRPSLQATTPR